MKGASIRTSGKSSLSKQPLSKVGKGGNVKAAQSKGSSSKSRHGAGFHTGYGKGSVKGSLK